MNRYAEVAKNDSEGKNCCESLIKTDDSLQLGYSKEETASVPEGADMGLGCGNPGAVAALKEGEIVLDLGSAGGFDCFLAARQVGNTGHVIGVDMTPEMIHKARVNIQKNGYKNVEFRLGEIEALPVGDNSVDVIISNCVINLSTNKQQVFKEAARVLRKGGRLVISDIVATSELPEKIKLDLDLYRRCIAGVASVEELESALHEAGLSNIKISLKEESRNFIKNWVPGSGAEQYVVSATIEAYKI